MTYPVPLEQTKSMPRLAAFTSVVVGICLVVLAGVYFIEPAKSLPHFIPGYDSQLTRHHYTHGIATLILGVFCFVFAWFQSGKRSAK